MNKRLEYIKGVARCPVCRGDLTWERTAAECSSCATRFALVDEVPLLVAEGISEPEAEREQQGLLHSLPPSLRGLADRSRRFIRPSLVHRSPQKRALTSTFVAALPSGATVLNVGAGGSVFEGNVVNLDIAPTPGIHVVGRAERLPFSDEAFDGIIFQAVLEHVENSDQALKEILRVLRPGGALFLEVPFMQGYHPAPRDHRRYTEKGLAAELEQHGFVVEETGVAVGPASAMAWVTGEFLALLLSGRSARGYRIARLATDWIAWPIKWADAWLDKHELAHVIASGVWARASRPIDAARGRAAEE